MPSTTAQRGFTLIELLVSLVLMGIILGVALLSVGTRDDDAPLREEAHRIAEVLRLVAEEAVLRGQSAGLVVKGDTYSVVRRRDGDWVSAADAALYRTRTLPAGVRLLRLKDASSREPVEPDPAEDEDKLIPILVFQPFGLSTGFLLRLEDAQNRACEVQGDELAEIVWSCGVKVVESAR